MEWLKMFAFFRSLFWKLNPWCVNFFSQDQISKLNIINISIDDEHCLRVSIECDSIFAINVIHVLLDVNRERLLYMFWCSMCDLWIEAPSKMKWHQKCTAHAVSSSIRWIHINQVRVCNDAFFSKKKFTTNKEWGALFIPPAYSKRRKFNCSFAKLEERDE